MYPEKEWLPWKFVSCPLEYWNDVNNQTKFVEWAAKQLKIKEMSDWYNVTLKVVITQRPFVTLRNLKKLVGTLFCLNMMT
jgi:hypothetical protein